MTHVPEMVGLKIVKICESHYKLPHQKEMKVEIVRVRI